jgi:hypothetical protein
MCFQQYKNLRKFALSVSSVFKKLLRLPCFFCFVPCDTFTFLSAIFEMTVDGVVVYISHSLKVRVTDGCAKEPEPSLFHIPANRVGQRRRRRNFACIFRMVHDWLPFRQKTGEIVAKTAKFLLNFNEMNSI